jgi:hypothetical protein
VELLLGLVVVLAGQVLETMSTRVTLKSTVLALLPEPVDPLPAEPEPLTSEPLVVEPPLGLEVPLCAVLDDVAVLVEAAEPALDPVPEEELGLVEDALPDTPPPVVPEPLIPEDPLALDPLLSGDPCTRT